MTIKSVRLLAGACLLSAVAISPAAAEDLVFMLNNQSSFGVSEFYASPVGEQSWEDDILGTSTLPSGSAVRVTIADGRSVCEYDMLIVFEDGDQVEDAGVDLCATGSYSVED
jgi:hypothetical protein